MRVSQTDPAFAADAVMKCCMNRNHRQNLGQKTSIKPEINYGV